MKDNINLDPVFPFLIRKRKEDENSQGSFKTNFYQLLHILEGSIFYRSNEGILKRNAVVSVFIPPLEGFKLRFKGPIYYYNVIINDLFFEELKLRTWDRRLFPFKKDKIIFFTFPKDKDERPTDIISLIMKNLLDEQEKEKTGYKDIIRLKLSELFINLARVSLAKSKIEQEPVPDISASAKGFNEILNYIQENYTESLTLQDVADFAGYSPSYFSRYFKNNTNICLFEYINRIRIKKACLLLKKTNETVLEIAYTVGYNNVSFFNRYFKKITNLSPVEYRRR